MFAAPFIADLGRGHIDGKVYFLIEWLFFSTTAGNLSF
jgi:hypothetical protein